MQGRFHQIVESQVDDFIDACNKYLDEKGIIATAEKDFDSSIVAIGDSDKNHNSPGFGFVMPYEQILSNIRDAFDEFKFKVQHFMNNADKFNAFKKESNNDNNQNKGRF